MSLLQSVSNPPDPYLYPKIAYFRSPREASRQVKTDDVLFVEGATWCQHCRRIAPFVRKLADEGVKVIYVDQTEALRDAPQSLPRLSVYSRGRLIDTLTGGPDEQRLREFFFESVKARHVALARDVLKSGKEIEAAKRVLLTTLEIAPKEDRGVLMAVRGIAAYSKAHPEDREVVPALLDIVRKKSFGDLSMSVAVSLQDLRKENATIDEWFVAGSKMRGVDDKWFALTLKQFQKSSTPEDRKLLTQLAGDKTVAAEIRWSAYHTLFWNFGLKVMSGADERRSFAQLTKQLVDEQGSGGLATVSNLAFTLFPEIKKLLQQK